MKQKYKQYLLLAGLLALIIPGNLISLELFFGVNFIFGNIFVFLIAFMFGPLWALAGGVLSSLGAYFVWGHFLTAPLFIGEAIFVAILYRIMKKGTPVEFVVFFWLFLGVPAGLFLYRIELGLDRAPIVMTLLKHFLNSIFCASVSGLALAMPQMPFLYKKYQSDKKHISLYDLTCAVLIIFFTFTILLILVVQNRAFEDRAIDNVKDRMVKSGDGFLTYLNEWKNRKRYSLYRLSYELNKYDLEARDERIQDSLELFFVTIPDFNSLYLGNKQGEIIAEVAAKYEDGNKTVGLDLSVDDYYQEMKRNMSPVFTDFFLPRDTDEPVVAVLSPIHSAGQFQGFLYGTLLIEPLIDVLYQYRGTPDLNITLIDSEGKVIVSTENYEPMEIFQSREGGIRIPRGDGVLQWYPDGLPNTMKSFQESKLYYKSVIPELNWTLYIEEDVAPQVSQLIRISLNSNIIAIILILILIPLVKLFLAGISRSLVKLMEVTSSPLDEFTGQVEWPRSRVREFHNLINQYQTVFEHQQLNSRLLTEQNRKLVGANSALGQSEENLRITLRSIGDGVIVTDAEGQVTDLNPVATGLCGWTNDEARGKDVREILDLKEEYSGTGGDRLEKVLRKGASLHSGIPYILENRDGHLSTVTIGAEPIRISQESEIRGAVIIIRDISETRKLENQLRQSQKMEVIGQLAGGIAHDFNNLLAGVLGLNEMIQGDLPEGSTHWAYTNDISKLVARASDLTHKLLAFSRKGKMTSKVFNLHDVIDETVSILERTIDKSIRIEKQLEANQYDIAGDPTQIQSVFMNIALNARDAMPDGGELVIATRTTRGLQSVETSTGIKMITGPHVRISIRDTGSGIEKKVLPHIFEPFFTTKKVGQGSGMSLSAVFGAVSEHNGVITVSSEVGKGTCFEIYLPVAKSRKALYKPEELAVMRGGETILVIDDEEIIRNSLRVILTELGYQVFTAPGGKEGMEIYRENLSTISLIILDAVMAEMPGLDVLKALKNLNPLVRVIIATGYSSESTSDQFRNAGALDFISKPFTIDDLNNRIRRILNK